MTDVAWPGAFPQIAVLTGYDEQRLNALGTFKPDMPGRPLTERRADLTGMMDVKIPIRFTKTQFPDFEDFWDDDLLEGAYNLIYPDFLRGGTRRLTFTEPFKHGVIAPTLMLVTLIAFSEPV